MYFIIAVELAAKQSIPVTPLSALLARPCFISNMATGVDLHPNGNTAGMIW